MTKQKNFATIFDADGNFVVEGYDPHYCDTRNPEHMKFHYSIFDRDGNFNETFDIYMNDNLQSLDEYITEIFQENPGMSPFCDAVKLYFANEASSATDSQYSTASMFK